MQRSGRTDRNPAANADDAEDGRRSVGATLEPFTRDAMQARFGEDFDVVRIHTDQRAQDAAVALNADAFRSAGT